MGRSVAPTTGTHGCDTRMTDIGDSLFHKGDPIWVIGPDGSQRAAEYVGEAETSTWFGGPPLVIVVYPDAHEGEMVNVDRVVSRDLRDENRSTGG
jgi:hypothetical protein